jgi:hypothetical protein
MCKPSLAWCLLLVASCGGSTEPPSPPARGIQFVGGAVATDTIDAILGQPLVVEVHDSSGRLAPVGTLVTFSGAQRKPLIVFEAQVRAPGASRFEPVVTGATDTNGRVAVEVRLDFVAGPARVVVSAPALGVSDTAHYMIVPGNPYDVWIEPLDTTIYVGQSYSMRGGVIDRGRNVRPDPPTWTTSDSGLSVTSTGVVSATAFGRYSIIARRTSNNATGVSASVVPQLRLVGCANTRVTSIDIDGTNSRDLTPIPIQTFCVGPRWIPGTSTLVFTNKDFATPVVSMTDENRALRRFLVNPPPTLTEHAEPAPTANGEWVYFSAFDSRCSSLHPCLYRARVDGTAAELLGSASDFPTGARQPSPSPDGTKVAFVAMNGGVSVIKVFDVAAGAASSWSVPGRYPAWSPMGTHIAFTPSGGGRPMLMNSDGTGIRALTTISFDEEPLNWSVDGRWLVSHYSDYGVVLFDVTSGGIIPAKLLAGTLATPSFR